MAERVASPPISPIAPLSPRDTVRLIPIARVEAQPRPPEVERTLYGLHMDLTFEGSAASRSLAVARAKEIHAQLSRNSFLWHKIERQRGARDWSVPDAVVAELAAAGIEPLFTVYGSPAWASGTRDDARDYYLYVPTEAAAFELWLSQYKAFMHDAALRYKGRVKKWELWNEENQHFFWKPAPDLDRYARWYREIHRTIKEVDPEAQIALGGLTGLCCGPPGDYSGKAFLAGLYDRGVYPEIVAIHPYAGRSQAPDETLAWENNFTDVGVIHDLMLARGQRAAKLWITEWGWSTGTVSESTQAEYVERSLRMLATQYRYVSLAVYFLDHDRSTRYLEGLYDANFRLKPAGARFRDFLK